MPSPASSILRSSWFAVVVLAAVALTAYHNSFSGALVLDDFGAITTNESIRHLWPLGPVLSPPSGVGVGGRPVANLTFALGYAIGGTEVRAHHAFNLLVHGLAALTLYGLLRRTLSRPALPPSIAAAAPALALAIAALWAAHPLTTAVVDYISQRTEALMALFYLLTLYAFARAAEKPATALRWSVVAVVACALGMASKEVMVTAPVLVLLYDRTFLSSTWREVWQRRGRLHLALAATWGLLAYLMIASGPSARGVGFEQGVPWWAYTLTETTAITRYVQLAAWPHPLIFDHGWPYLPRIAAVLPDILICLSLIGLTLFSLRRQPLIGFALAWFLVVLAPTSSVIPVAQQPIAESRAYLPLVGLLTLGVTTVFAAVGRRLWIAVAIVVAAAAAATIQRNNAYKSEIGLWRETIAARSDNPRAYSNLGAALFNAGREAEAAEAFRAALRLRPDYPDANNNLAAYLVRLGRPAEALPLFNVALDGKPDLNEAYYNRAQALMQLGRAEEAIASLNAALRLNPRLPRAHNDLSAIFLERGRTAEAIEEAQTALRLDPNLPEAHYNLANALLKAERIPEAIQHYHEVLRIDARFARAEHNLAVALVRSGDLRGAVEHFEAALRIRPDYPEAKRNLELVRASLK